MCDLGDADVGVGQHRLGSLDIVARKFWRTTSGAARAPRRREARLGGMFALFGNGVTSAGSALTDLPLMYKSALGGCSTSYNPHHTAEGESQARRGGSWPGLVTAPKP